MDEFNSYRLYLFSKQQAMYFLLEINHQNNTKEKEGVDLDLNSLLCFIVCCIKNIYIILFYSF